MLLNRLLQSIQIDINKSINDFIEVSKYLALLC